MTGDATAVRTGNATLDAALEGGLAWGATVLVEGEEGAGGPEFALSLLRHAARGGSARLATALRAPERVRRELAALFPSEPALARVDVRAAGDEKALHAALDLPPGAVLVVESATAFARLAHDGDAAALLRRLSDAAAGAGVCLVLLAPQGALAQSVDAALAEVADVVLDFRWIESGVSRRRLLRVRKVRGLASVLDAEQVPIFEVGLHRGSGFTVARVSSLV